MIQIKQQYEQVNFILARAPTWSKLAILALTLITMAK